jgi:RND family efflux transporter MFP subunit
VDGGKALPSVIVGSCIFMRRVRRSLRITATLLAILALSPFGCKKQATAPEAVATPDVAVEMTKSETAPIETTVTAQGTITAAQGASARLASPISGRIVTVTVKEGDRVSAGQLIASIDNRPQQAQATSAQAAAVAAEAQARSADLAAGAAQADHASAVHLAQLSLQAAQIDRDANVQTAQSELDTAQTDFQKTKAGPRPQEVAQAQQAVNQAKANRDRASTEVDRVKFLYEKGIDAKRQYDDAETALKVADSALESANQQLSLLRAGARPEDLKAASIKVQQAQQAVAQAKATGEAKVAQAQASLRQARQSALQITVKRQDARAMHDLAASKRADFAAARTTAAFAEVRAPFSGIVTKRSLNPGDIADTTAPIVEISSTRAMNLVGSVSAEDGQQLRAGMRAHITAADVPNRVFPGMVLNVGQVDPQTNLLTVRLSVADARGVLRAGTFASAEIVVRTSPNAVVVPKQAIVSKEGKSAVFVVGADGKAHQKEVTVGTEQEGKVEILKGLASGEKIVKLGQYELSDGAKVHEAEHAEAPAPGGEGAAEK